MELQECVGGTLRAAVDFSRGRRVSKTQQQTHHEISPQQREELPDYRGRIHSLKKPGRLCLGQNGRHSDFGSLPQAGGFLVKVARYF